MILFVFLFVVFSSRMATLYKRFNPILVVCSSVICLIICLCPKIVSECCFDVVSLSVYVWCICIAVFVTLSEKLLFFINIKETKLEGLSVFLGNVLHCFAINIIIMAMCSKWSVNVNIYSYLNCCMFLSQNTQVYLTLHAVIITLPP